MYVCVYGYVYVCVCFVCMCGDVIGARQAYGQTGSGKTYSMFEKPSGECTRECDNVHVCVCVYVCMCVCMYVCVYVCMYTQFTDMFKCIGTYIFNACVNVNVNVCQVCNRVLYVYMLCTSRVMNGYETQMTREPMRASYSDLSGRSCTCRW